jgi:hypothetical protein
MQLGMQLGTQLLGRESQLFDATHTPWLALTNKWEGAHTHAHAHAQRTRTRARTRTHTALAATTIMTTYMHACPYQQACQPSPKCLARWTRVPLAVAVGEWDTPQPAEGRRCQRRGLVPWPRAVHRWTAGSDPGWSTKTNPGPGKNPHDHDERRQIGFADRVHGSKPPSRLHRAHAPCRTRLCRWRCPCARGTTFAPLSRWRCSCVHTLDLRRGRAGVQNEQTAIVVTIAINHFYRHYSHIQPHTATYSHNHNHNPSHYQLRTHHGTRHTRCTSPLGVRSGCRWRQRPNSEGSTTPTDARPQRDHDLTKQGHKVHTAHSRHPFPSPTHSLSHTQPR